MLMKNQKMWDENLDSRQETERLIILMLPVTEQVNLQRNTPTLIVY